MELTFFTSIILGIVEGLSEFAPISSTAHILLSGAALSIQASDFFSVFVVAIQSGAIVAAIIYFWSTILNRLSIIPKIAVGFLPTAVVGLLFHSFISTLFANNIIIAIALIVGGIIFLFLKPIDTDSDVSTISYKQAFLIGCAQLFAFIPGMSRSGSTLIGGTLLRIPRGHIVAFSFILGIPTILGASVVQIQSIPPLSNSQWTLITVGSLTAFVTALLTMKWFITLLTKKPLSWFGWYRIILGIIVLIFVV